MDLNLLGASNDLDVLGGPTGLDVPGISVRLAIHDISRLKVGFLCKGVDVNGVGHKWPANSSTFWLSVVEPPVGPKDIPLFPRPFLWIASRTLSVASNELQYTETKLA